MLKLCPGHLVLMLTGLLGQSASSQAASVAASKGFYPVAIITASPAGGAEPARVMALLLGVWQAGRWQTPAAAAPLLRGSQTWRMQALGTTAQTAGHCPEQAARFCPETRPARKPSFWTS